MSKYINADELIGRIYRENHTYKNMLSKEISLHAEKMDGIEIVRCKDCKHREKNECNNIVLGSTKCGVYDEWFCADGERRESE